MSIDLTDLSEDPIEELNRWVARAERHGMADPTAAALATATAGGVPSVRIVLLKQISSEGITFVTNHNSRKAREIDSNPSVALTVYFREWRRQVVIDGKAERMGRDEIARYFKTRARGSQIASWVVECPGQECSNLLDLAERFSELEHLYEDEEVPLPEFWGGYRISPVRIEFWSQGEHRIHDRISYSRTATGWDRMRIA